MTQRRSHQAFSLVEITLALGVAAFSLLAIFGLLATGVQINHTATEQSASVSVLTAVAADLRATPATVANSLQFDIPIPPKPITAITTTTLYFDSTGQSSKSLIGSSRYRVVVSFLQNAGVRTATLADLRLTWPAAADPTNASTGASETFVALDRN